MYDYARYKKHRAVAEGQCIPRCLSRACADLLKSLVLIAYRWKGLERILEGGSSREEFSVPAVPRGLYMHGGVGTGKTMLMDLLVETAPPEFKVGALMSSCR